MAIALVQSAVAHGPYSGGGTVSYPGATTATNMLTIHGNFHVTSATGLSSITDTAGNTWTFSTSNSVNQNPPVAIASGGSGTMSFAAWTLNAASAISVTFSGSAIDFATLAIAEWSGVGSADTAAAVASSAIGGGLSLSASLTLAGSGELVLLGSNESNSWGSGPAALTAFPGGNAPYIGYALSQSGSPTYTWSSGAGSSDAATIAVAAFQPPAGGPPSGTVQPATAIAAPRRKPARAVVRFTPVTTTNGPAKPIPSRGTPPSDEAREWKRWLLWR